MATTVNGKKDNTSADSSVKDSWIARMCPTLLNKFASSAKKRTVYLEGPVKGETYTNWGVEEVSPGLKVISTSSAGAIWTTGDPEKDDTAKATNEEGA